MSAITPIDACARCGAAVRREIPADLTGVWRERAATMPLVCARCAQRRSADDAEQERRRAEEAGRRDAARRLRSCGLPERLRAARLASVDGPEHQRAARRWVAGELLGLVLSGPVGTGKTWTAAAAARAMVAHRRVAWTSAPLLLAWLGAGIGSARHAAALELITGRTALVLDDADKARPSDYGAEQLFLAVDARVEHRRPLLVTTNLTLGELAARYPQPYGEAIASRLAGYCEHVELTGPDRRMDGIGGER
ncbi:MAG TPA: ATP-binding protein [Conexibacter sp.]|nr:ATP-binding protein [Conexibacter sp.]